MVFQLAAVAFDDGFADVLGYRQQEQLAGNLDISGCQESYKPSVVLQLSEPMPQIEAQRAAVYRRAKEQGKVTRKEVEQERGFGSTKAFKVLKTLCDAGLLKQLKNGNQTVYVPLK